MQNRRLWLIFIILIGFALRLLWLGEQSLWYDEGVTWMLSQMNLPDLIDWTAADIQPPLYYLLIWLTDILWGDSEWALRFPSALFNTLTIPLMYVLARRLFPNSRPAPLLAAGLLALSPLMVYYSQEARMYTLLTLQATLASYLLLKILHPSHNSVRSLSGGQLTIRNSLFAIQNYYLLTAAAALYTHYFAAFLLLAHGLYASIILWQRHFERRLLLQLAWAFGGTLLLFAPWLPILLARLGDDPSYWPGALKLDEALRKVAISFTLGETVFEPTGWPLALGYLALLLLCGLWMIASQRFSGSAGQQVSQSATQPAVHNSQFNIRNSQLFLWLWLLLPIVLILALSYQSPKFNPRYTLIAWPPFALILAQALAALHRPLAAARPALKITQHVLRFTFYGFILTTFTFSLTHWFTDPRFSKDDFQALAQFVKERKAEDETVLLSSGHLFPVWAYYYGWEGWTPLPWMLRLDVNRVTDLTIADEMAEALADQGGAWLVTWQDEVIDPNGVVPFWLDVVGERPNDAGDFWGVGLEHWRLDPNDLARLSESPIERPLSVNFNNRVDLIGMTQLNDEELTLFWQPRQPLPDELLLTLNLTDRDGFNWDEETTIGRPGNYAYPPARWPVGQTVITRHRLPWLTGTPPGLYVAEVGLGTPAESGDFSGWDVLDAQGRPARRTALVEHVNVSQLVRPENGPLPQDKSPLVDLFPIIGLRRSILPDDTAQPGDRLLLALLWQAGEYNLDDVSVAFDLVDAAGQSFRIGSNYTPSRHFSLPRWQSGDMVLGQYWLDIPPQAAPGPAQLRLHIVNSGYYDYDEVFDFDTLEIQPTERNFSPPESPDMALDADFGRRTRLLGADCPANCTAAPGQSITLTLHWQALDEMDTAYTVFTHLLAADETVLINADHAPPKPTTGWVAGEIITDPVTLTLPADLPPGRYNIEVGLYDAADPAFVRLPLPSGDSRVILPQPLTVE